MRKIRVFVKTNAKNPGIEVKSPGEVIARVDKPSKDGKANARLRELLAQHFSVSKSSVTIQKGNHSRYKVIEISD